MRNFAHLPRLQTLEETSRRLFVEQRIGRLDAQKKPVPRRAGEPLDIEDGVVGHWKPVQPQHSQPATNAANRIVISNVTGMNDGQLNNGRPPMFNG